MIIEGFMKKQSNGRYTIFGAESDCELTCGDCVEVKADKLWLSMRIEHDSNDYYLLSDGLSFYPKKVYARYDTSFRRF
jgi:hypothetical protein